MNLFESTLTMIFFWALDAVLREDYITPWMGMTGWSGIFRFWDTFVYSAFYDERGAVVRVISITLTRTGSKYRCHLWYNVTDDESGVTSQDLVVRSAVMDAIPESHKRM